MMVAKCNALIFVYNFFKRKSSHGKHCFERKMETEKMETGKMETPQIGDKNCGFCSRTFGRGVTDARSLVCFHSCERVKQSGHKTPGVRIW